MNNREGQSFLPNGVPNPLKERVAFYLHAYCIVDPVCIEEHTSTSNDGGDYYEIVGEADTY